MSEDRLKAIVERQAAVAKAQAERDERERQRLAEAKSVKERTTERWLQLKPLIIAFVRKAAEALKEHGKELYLSDTSDALSVGQITVQFEQFAPKDFKSQRLVISVHHEGTVTASFGTKQRWPAADYRADIATATVADFEGWILDFLDQNIEAPTPRPAG